MAKRPSGIVKKKREEGKKHAKRNRWWSQMLNMFDTHKHNKMRPSPHKQANTQSHIHINTRSAYARESQRIFSRSIDALKHKGIINVTQMLKHYNLCRSVKIYCRISNLTALLSSLSYSPGLWCTRASIDPFILWMKMRWDVNCSWILYNTDNW